MIWNALKGPSNNGAQCETEELSCGVLGYAGFSCCAVQWLCSVIERCLASIVRWFSAMQAL